MRRGQTYDDCFKVVFFWYSVHGGGVGHCDPYVGDLKGRRTGYGGSFTRAIGALGERAFVKYSVRGGTRSKVVHSATMYCTVNNELH